MAQLKNVLIVAVTGWLAGTLAWLAAWGMIPGLDIEQVSSEVAGFIVTAIITLLGIVITAVTNRLKKILEDLATGNAVKEIIVTDPALAQKITSEKVVSE